MKATIRNNPCPDRITRGHRNCKICDDHYSGKTNQDEISELKLGLTWALKRLTYAGESYPESIGPITKNKIEALVLRHSLKVK